MCRRGVLELKDASDHKGRFGSHWRRFGSHEGACGGQTVTVTGRGWMGWRQCVATVGIDWVDVRIAPV